MTAARVRGALCPRRVRSVREDLVLAHRLELADLREDGARVADGLDDVARARVALEPDHRGALGDAPQRLAEVLRAADEGDGEGALVDVVLLVGGGEDLRLVDAVHLPPGRGEISL